MNEIKEQVVNEWVLIGTHEPQNFYLGKLVPPTSYPYVPTTHGQLVDLVSDMIHQGVPIHLSQARFLLTMIQLHPNGGVQMTTQMLPISGSTGPIDLHVRASVVIFPSEVKGMSERLDEMSAAAADKEQKSRARAAGLELSTTPTNLWSR